MNEGELRRYQMPFSSRPFWMLGTSLGGIAMDHEGLLALNAWQLGCRDFKLTGVRAIVGLFLALPDVCVRLERAQQVAKERRAAFAVARNQAAAKAKGRAAWAARRAEEFAAHNLERGL